MPEGSRRSQMENSESLGGASAEGAYLGEAAGALHEVELLKMTRLASNFTFAPAMSASARCEAICVVVFFWRYCKGGRTGAGAAGRGREGGG